MSFSVVQVLIGSGAVTSGVIASGQVGWPHLASGAVQSGDLGITGGIPNGALFLRGDFAWGMLTVGSGAISSGTLQSGSVQGFFGTTPNISSGTVGRFDFGSGAVIAGAVGSGAIVSGNVASGQVGANQFGVAAASGNIASGQVGRSAFASGAVNSGHVNTFAVLGSLGGGVHNIASGTIGPNDIGAALIVSGNIASGQIGRNHLGSGAVLSGAIASGQVGQFAISAGAVSSGRLGVTGTPNGAEFLRDDFSWQGAVPGESSGQVLSGNIASGQIGTFHFASGDVVTYTRGLIFDQYMTVETISGVRCASITKSGFIQMAMAAVSGRMPATGVVFTNALSGTLVNVVRYGNVLGPASEIGSGLCISGRMGRSLWVGASGQLVTISGGGPTIGVGVGNSGSYGQYIGTSAASGAVLIDIVPSQLFSGAAAITTNPQCWPV